MKWKDRQGKEVGAKEFMSRWKAGIQQIDSFTQLKYQIRSSWLVIVGIIAGIVVSLFNAKNVWWLTVILLGALGNSIVQMIGLLQKRNSLKQFEHMFNNQSGEGGK